MYFDDLKIGMSVQIAPAVIEKQKMMDFAQAYDNIPLHTDEAYAKASPFGALIAPGVMSFMSVWAKYLEVDFFGGEPLMNWEVVKKLVEYARSIEKEHNKNFRFTLTTNGMLIDDDVIEKIDDKDEAKTSFFQRLFERIQKADRENLLHTLS